MSMVDLAAFAPRKEDILLSSRRRAGERQHDSPKATRSAYLQHHYRERR